MINIVLTGKVKEGKSTFLKEYFSGKGFARAYLRLEDKFYFYPQGKVMPYFLSGKGIPVGKYFINPKIFEEVIVDFKEKNQDFNFFVLDELGTLELYFERGFYQFYTNYLLNKKNNLVVVRESLLEEFLKKFYQKSFFLLNFTFENKDFLSKKLDFLIKSTKSV